MTSSPTMFAAPFARIGALLACLAATPAAATLAPGASAPAFVANGAEAGKPFRFDLKAALRRGPVVLYFYPKAFTHGCTLEAHAFAEAMDDFHKAGATVVGMSADDQPALAKFSRLECRDRFPVATATPQIIRQYDVALSMAGISSGFSNRTTYVIDRAGKVKLAHTDMDWRAHVPKALEAVRALQPR